MTYTKSNLSENSNISNEDKIDDEDLEVELL